MGYVKLKPPTKGQKITMGPGMKLNVPDNPIVLYIEGDGTGPDLWAASVRVFDAAVQKAYGGKRRIEWFEVYAGEKCNKIYGEGDRKSTRLNSSHSQISYAVFCLKKKK